MKFKQYFENIRLNALQEGTKICLFVEMVHLIDMHTTCYTQLTKYIFRKVIL